MAIMTFKFNPEIDVISVKNTTNSELVGYRVVTYDTENDRGVALPVAGEIKILGILMPSIETDNGLIPVGRSCDVVINNEYLVEIAEDVKIGDILVVADTLGRVRPLSENELDVISGSSTKIGVLGIATESATYVEGKNILIRCRIQKGILEVPVTS